MILITGGAGYIGSHCALNFIRAGYDLVVFDNLETGHAETVETLRKAGRVEFVEGDLRNSDDLERLFSLYDIEAVIHFAGLIAVEESVHHPDKYYRTNVAGTLNLLDAMCKHGVNRIIFSSTCAVCGEPEYVPLDELHTHNPLNAYGASKAMVERLLFDYGRAYGLQYVILRYFNVIGADSEGLVGEWHEPETHLIPNIIRSVVDPNKTFTIYGNDYSTIDGTCVRDYVNVEDLAEAHRLAYLYLAGGGQSDVFNLGTETGSSVKEIFDTCQAVLNVQINLQMGPRRSGDAAMLYADSSKARQVLQWQPVRDLRQSIESAYKWEQELKGRLS